MRINNYLNVLRKSILKVSVDKVHCKMIKEGLSVSLKRVQRLIKSVGLVSTLFKRHIYLVNNLKSMF